MTAIFMMRSPDVLAPIRCSPVVQRVGQRLLQRVARRPARLAAQLGGIDAHRPACRWRAPGPACCRTSTVRPARASRRSSTVVHGIRSGREPTLYTSPRSALLHQQHVGRDHVAHVGQVAARTAGCRSPAPAAARPRSMAAICRAKLATANSGDWRGPMWLNGRTRTMSRPGATGVLIAEPGRRRPCWRRRDWSGRSRQSSSSACSAVVGVAVDQAAADEQDARPAAPADHRLVQAARGGQVAGPGGVRLAGTIGRRRRSRPGGRSARAATCAQHRLDARRRRTGRRRAVRPGRPGGAMPAGQAPRRLRPTDRRRRAPAAPRPDGRPRSRSRLSRGYALPSTSLIRERFASAAQRAELRV